MSEKQKKKRNKQGVTAKSGKAYQYTRITRKVGKHKNKRGMWVSDYKQFTGKSLKDAEAKYEKYMTRVSLNGMTAFGEYFDWYKENILSHDDTLKEGTKIKYINDFERAFGDSPLLKCDISEISGIDIQSIINESDSGATTIRQAVKLLRRFYKYLDSQNIVHDVTRSLTLPKVEHKRIDQQVEVYSDEELKRLLNGMPKEHRLRFLVTMAINTGCRIGELLALKYDDISVEEGQVSINKTLSEIEKSKDAEEGKTTFAITSTKTLSGIRSIPLNENVLKEYARHKKWHQAEMMKKGYRTDFIFTSSSGNHYYKKNLERALKRLCNSDTVKIEHKGWHCFRRTFGTKLASNGVPIQVLSKLMGHQNIEVTSKYYINVSTDEKRDAIMALGL